MRNQTDKSYEAFHMERQGHVMDLSKNSVNCSDSGAK